MPKAKDISAELAQLQRDREAVVAQQRALDERERLLLQRRKIERAKIISDAFAEVYVGDVDKRQATRLARAVKRLGIEQLLAFLEAPAPPKLGAAEPGIAGDRAGAPAPSGDPSEPPKAGEGRGDDLGQAASDSGAAEPTQVELAA